ncbi:MAG: serine/threonine-protein phosphatase [Planctomycetes bacterium]|nr:serine/threonine-protein phosphatase [Planctomycetota bacterium]
MSVCATWREEGSGWLVRAGADTQTGNYRERNEDLVLLDPELPLALVLDGMGGPDGARAAQIGAEAIRERIRDGRGSDEPPEVRLDAAFRAGHDAITDWQTTNTERGACAATAVGAWVHDGHVYVTWIGDSRAYRLTGGRLERLTRDHNLGYALVRAGRMSEDEARDARGGHRLISFLGGWNLDGLLEVPSFVPLPGDRLILATDGVTCLLEDGTFLNACRTVTDPATCAEVLIEHALMRGSRDNCTCAVIAFEWPGEGPPPEAPSQPPQSPHPPEPRKWWRFWK